MANRGTDFFASDIATASKLGIDAPKTAPDEGFKRDWPPLIRMDAAVRAKNDLLL